MTNYLYPTDEKIWTLLYEDFTLRQLQLRLEMVKQSIADYQCKIESDYVRQAVLEELIERKQGNAKK